MRNPFTKTLTLTATGDTELAVIERSTASVDEARAQGKNGQSHMVSDLIRSQACRISWIKETSCSQNSMWSRAVFVFADLATNRNLWKSCWMLRVIEKKEDEAKQVRAESSSGTPWCQLEEHAGRRMTREAEVYSALGCRARSELVVN